MNQRERQRNREGERERKGREERNRYKGRNEKECQTPFSRVAPLFLSNDYRSAMSFMYNQFGGLQI